MKSFTLDGTSLTIDQVYKIAVADYPIKFNLSESAIQKIKNANDYVKKIATDTSKTVYGINTGFGALSNKKIAPNDLEKLQINLIRSHCTGVGAPFQRPMTRAIMLLRANCLIQGHSGVKKETIDLLLSFLEHDVLPIIPSKGSVGASGDLAPLAHMSLALIGEGEVVYKGEKISAAEAIKAIGAKTVVLGPKEGLALINGTTVMAALGALAVKRAQKLAKLCDISAAITLDGLQGSAKPFDPDISRLKPHPGQISVSKNLNTLLKGSTILTSHKNCGKVQDPYSLRCIPQVHGACRQTILHAEAVISLEMNAVTDNPLIFVEDDKVISGGNFHGEALALVMDYMSMGMSELCSILERRVEKMMNPTFSDLPAFLTKDSGLNSGLMIAHVTVAALASENKLLCHPASVDSIPTSTDKEDHVSMGVTAGRKLHEVLNNLKTCLAIELLCSTQALEFIDEKTSPVLEAVYTLIRKTVPPINEDRVFADDIQKIIQLIENNSILETVDRIVSIE